MDTPEVTYVILNYNPNGSEHITPKFEECVHALYRNSDPSIKKEVIVIDQGSPESVVNSIHKLNVKYQFCEVLLARNVGISAGINMGFQMARGKRVALLTYDVLLTKGADKSCLALLDAHPEVWHVVPLSDKGDNPHQVHRVKEAFGSDTISVLPKGFEEAVLIELTVNYFSRTLLEKIGYFDERWMACQENIDYTFRTLLAGGKTVINREAYAWHYHNTSSRYVGRNHFYEGRYNGDPFADGRINKLWLDKWGPDINKDTRLDSWLVPPSAVIEKYKNAYGKNIFLGWPQEHKGE